MAEIVLGILCLTWKGDKPFSVRCYYIFVTHFCSTPVCPYFPKLSLLPALTRSVFSGFVLNYSACHLWGQALTAVRLVGVSWMWITGTELMAKDCLSHPADSESDLRAGAENPLIPRGMSARHGTLHPLSLGLATCAWQVLLTLAAKGKTGPYFWELLVKLFLRFIFIWRCFHVGPEGVAGAVPGQG